MKISSILKKYSLFKGLDQEQIEQILPFLAHETFEAGTNIFTEGSLNDKIMLILEGRVAVLKRGIILMDLDEGSVFGEMEVLDVEPLAATIKALAATKVIVLSVDALGKIYETDLKIYSCIVMNLARIVTVRLRRMDNKTANQSPFMDWN